MVVDIGIVFFLSFTFLPSAQGDFMVAGILDGGVDV
jgi:hypothetical protein